MPFQWRTDLKLSVLFSLECWFLTKIQEPPWNQQLLLLLHKNRRLQGSFKATKNNEINRVFETALYVVDSFKVSLYKILYILLYYIVSNARPIIFPAIY